MVRSKQLNWFIIVDVVHSTYSRNIIPKEMDNHGEVFKVA